MKKQQKRVVCNVPVDGAAADVCAWRKYGQKPIKGSPFPRGYYRCSSSSKGCPARKQVERSRTDPGKLLITYCKGKKKDDDNVLYEVMHIDDGIQVPVAAAVYYEDMYVNFNLSMETTSEIAGIRLWVTNEFMHSGLRDGGSQVFDQLIGMLEGKKPWF